MWRASGTYETCSLLEALARVPSSSAFETLDEIFRDTAYAPARRRAAQAMAVADSGFADAFASECLWDCDPTTRQIGISHAPLTPSVRNRLLELSRLAC
jgi:hypothetical protein